MSTMTASPTKESTDRDFVISRTFDAPRDIVFKAWTEPEGMRHGWGPKDWRVRFNTAAECDKVRGFTPACNEQNFDRLEAVLKKTQGVSSEL
jgi:uncharacterized protein YndB with AHSA1/START domain